MSLETFRHFICKFFLMMLCTDEWEMYALCFWQNDGCVGSVLDFAQAQKQTQCYYHYALTVVDHYWQGNQLNQVCQFLESDLNLHDSLRNLYTVYCFSLSKCFYHQRKMPFCFINVNDNTMSQLRHHKLRAAQVWWLNLITELATIHLNSVSILSGETQTMEHGSYQCFCITW